MTFIDGIKDSCEKEGFPGIDDEVAARLYAENPGVWWGHLVLGDKFPVGVVSGALH